MNPCARRGDDSYVPFLHHIGETQAHTVDDGRSCPRTNDQEALRTRVLLEPQLLFHWDVIAEEMDVHPVPEQLHGGVEGLLPREGDYGKVRSLHCVEGRPHAVENPGSSSTGRDGRSHHQLFDPAHHFSDIGPSAHSDSYDEVAVLRSSAFGAKKAEVLQEPAVGVCPHGDHCIVDAI